MANGYVKRCSMFLVSREMQIKTTMTYHLTLVGMAIAKKSTNNKCWRLWREKGNLLHCWWEYKSVQPLGNTVWRFLKKLKTELPYDSAIPLLGICHEKNIIQKDACTPVFTTALFAMAHTWSQYDVPIRGVEKEGVVYIYNGILLSHKKKKIISFLATWMDLEIIILTEVNQRKF